MLAFEFHVREIVRMPTSLRCVALCRVMLRGVAWRWMAWDRVVLLWCVREAGKVRSMKQSLAAPGYS